MLNVTRIDGKVSDVDIRLIANESIIFVAKDEESLPDFNDLDYNVCFDLKLAEDTVIPHKSRHVLAKTGLKVSYPEISPLGLFIYPRSSLFVKTGLILANHVGIIDPSYRGEILLSLYALDVDKLTSFVDETTSDGDLVLPKGTRLCQATFQLVYRGRLLSGLSEIVTLKLPRCIYYIVDEDVFNRWDQIVPSRRGEGGFGSTGTK